MKTKLMVVCMLTALLTISVSAQASIMLNTPTAGDATYAWNSKYGPYGYGVGETTMGVGLYMGAPYGNDYTVSIFEIPLAPLAGKDLASATLLVDSLGFGTGYWYGSASIGWLDTGTAVLTGDVVADGLGPASTGRPGGFTIYNSDYPDTPGLKSFDVLSCVQADLAASRAYSTFVMSGSRDTYGSIYTAESGFGPRISTEVVPEPATMTMLGMGLAGMLLRYRRKR
ncbi:MAG: PEP-CTERM sorting domain-containing protein [Armatimonadota bacterium]